MSKSTGVEIDRLSVYQFNITRNTHELLPIFRCLCLSFFAIPLIWFDCIMVDFAIFIRQRDLSPLVFCPAKSAFYHSQLEFCSYILCLCLASQMNAIFTVMVISVHIICIHKWCWWWYYRTRIQVHTSFTQPYTNSVNTNINMKRIYHSICTRFFLPLYEFKTCFRIHFFRDELHHKCRKITFFTEKRFEKSKQNKLDMSSKSEFLFLNSSWNYLFHIRKSGKIAKI